jgi:S1-C subfamily serine protease
MMIAIVRMAGGALALTLLMGSGYFPGSLPSAYAQKRVVLPNPKTVTVRIAYTDGAGSGVIVARKDNRFLVLTNYHVVDDAPSKRQPYTVHTFDGKRYMGQYWGRVGNLDAAFIVFSADQTYPVARLGRSSALAPDATLTAVGFPNWIMLSRDLIRNTIDQGFQAYTETNGNFRKLLSPKESLQEGYRLGYSNDVQNGMSGGAIFSSDNLLVGINGRLKNPVYEVQAYRLESGATPSIQSYESMRNLSWGIPIESLLDEINKYKQRL